MQRNPPEAIVAEVVGSDRRLKSEVRQLLEIQLGSETDGTTVVVRATISLSGLLATLAKNLIEMQMQQVLGDFAEAFRVKVNTTARERLREL